MQPAQGSIFKARESIETTSVRNEASITNDSLNGSGKTSVELTKNKKYCVSKLPALPSVLVNNETFPGLNGYSDNISNYSLVINEKAIHVWNYKSTDPAPLLIQFPLDTQSSMPLLPLAILCKPSNGATQDPGLVIINSSTGLVKFYESVQHAPALGLINNKLLELTIAIDEKRGEYITLAENVEPAGIVIATSLKRCVLITLRDYKSKPKLSCIELLSPSNTSGFLSSIFSGFNKNEEVINEIVSIKSGRTMNNGMTQEIIVQDSIGNFNLFTYKMTSENGNPYIDRKKATKQNLIPFLENSIDGFLPGSSLDMKILDLWPLKLERYENIYLGLTYVKESLNKNLILMSMKIDQTGVLLYGSHKLARYDPATMITSSDKPKLFVPAPGTTAFITIDNSVIMTDLNTSYIDSKNTVKYYEPRWEDVIKLKPTVKIIGQGYEDKTNNSNASVVLITGNSGVLRFERFQDLVDESVADEDQFMDASAIIKTHVEQAIFYSSSTAIEFDLNINFSEVDVLNAINSILNEILYSSSPYLPTFLPSIFDFLTLKSQILHNLINYTQRNFRQIWSSVSPSIIEYLEKVEVALNLWTHINKEPSLSNTLKALLENVIEDLKVIQFEEGEDNLRIFFAQGIVSINQVITEFIARLVANNFSLSNLIDLVSKMMYDGVYLNEQLYVVKEKGTEMRKLWVFDTSLLINLEEVFTKFYCNVTDGQQIATEQYCLNLVHICEVLYYLVNIAIDYMKVNEGSNDQLIEYLKWYKIRKSYWINALLKRNLETKAINIVEKYEDFSSLASILDTERNSTMMKFGDDSHEYRIVLNKFDHYFEHFGYKFAKCLYDHYLKNNNTQFLLLGFEKYNHYRDQYFKSNIKKTAELAWIRYLVDQRFEDASETLVDSVSSKENENLDNIELKYSIAKLSTIAAKKNNMSDKIDERLLEIENDLVQVRAQNNLYQILMKYVSGEKELLKMDYFVKVFINDSIDNQLSKGVLSSFFERFVQNKALSSIDLINLLTLIKPSVAENNFFNALEISSLLTNEDKSKFYIRTIWLRLLTTTDDWKVLSKTRNKTDEHVKQKIGETILMKTLKLIHQDSTFMHELDGLLSEGRCLLDNQYEDNLNLNNLNEALLGKLQDFLVNHDLASWIESIKQELRYADYI